MSEHNGNHMIHLQKKRSNSRSKKAQITYRKQIKAWLLHFETALLEMSTPLFLFL